MPKEQLIPPKFVPDSPAREGIVAPRPSDNRILLHPTVQERIDAEASQNPQLSKRLGVIVQQLAAHGRTSRVKGCSDAKNRGWRRTPLGGSGGMHYYLWWTPRGSHQAKSLESLPRGTVLVRAVRHHDDHTPLRVGEVGEYFKLRGKDIDGDEGSTFEGPWTSAQRGFIQAEDGVRIVYGHPGSGKTIALWRAVETRRGGRTLYLSWSRGLIDQASKRLDAFTASDSLVDAYDFGAFLGGICQTDTSKLTLAESRRAFRSAFDWWKIRKLMGPWVNRLDALHAELRAVLFGCAVPDFMDCADGDARLSDSGYLAEGVSDVGPEAKAALLDVIGRTEWESWFGTVFPELHAARQALARLQNGGPPTALGGYDRVVVDEVQDLTLLEVAVVVEFCRRIAAKRGRAPWLLLAYDDGQTVRPSGFDAGRLKKLLGEWLVHPKDFGLEYNARSPKQIADVVYRASRLYTKIKKSWRPSDQQGWDASPEIDARLIHVQVPDDRAASRLIERIADVDDLAVVTTDFAPPEWIVATARESVLLPEVVKGLEYATVCVLNPGRVLKRLQEDLAAFDPLEAHARRTAIDRLRVALSRATENLVFVDVAPDDSERSLSLALLEEPERFTADDLVELVEDADAPLDERILARTRDARNLLEESPVRAWDRARQALRLLGESLQPDSISDEDVRSEACSVVLLVAASRLVDGGPRFSGRQEVVTLAGHVATTWAGERVARALRELDAWTKRREGPPHDLLDAVLALETEEHAWIRPVLPRIHNKLLDALRLRAIQPDAAERFAGDVEGWLSRIGFVGEAAGTADQLRNSATDTLLEGRRAEAAHRVLERVQSPEPSRSGRTLEMLGHHEGAAEAFEEAGMKQEALRNWRQEGRWEKAYPLAKRAERADMKWLSDLERIAQRRPAKLEKRLTEEERKRMNRLVRPLAVRPPKPAPNSEEIKAQGNLFDKS